MPNTPATEADARACWRSQWTFPEGVTYLNHGSFGPSPEPVLEARRQWLADIERQPMEFFVRRLEGLLEEAIGRLAHFVGGQTKNLVFVDNATVGMNVVAASFPLQPGDAVLTTDHEYGAVTRIWQRTCERVGAKLVVQELPWPVSSAEQIADAIFAGATERTRLLVISHVTSPTALVMPVQALCAEAGRRGIAVCIDGPHAPAMQPVDLERLDCDYYTASCHKWLSAPFGTGFLHVHPRRQDSIQPVVVSWGHMPLDTARHWRAEFLWVGTKDPSAYLTVPKAIEFMEEVGLDAFRRGTHELAAYARREISNFTGLEPPTPDDDQFYGSMVALPLPNGDARSLQDALYHRHKIETPIVPWKDGRLIRVSCHLYNRRAQIDILLRALQREL